MNKLRIVLILSVFITTLNAQNVGINSTGAAPHSSAGLDVNFTDKGVLIPRVALTALNSASPISSPTVSLLVYNTATAGSAPNNVVPGYYYWDGTQWLNILTPSSGGHYIGELYGGGVIFYLWKDAGVEHGLIASLVDLSDPTWGAQWSAVTNEVTSYSLSDGQANTTAMVADDGTPGYAGTLCDAYSTGGYTDWYLPSIWELDRLHDAAFVINTISGISDDLNDPVGRYMYWSSNNNGFFNAYAKNFYDGTVSSQHKTFDYCIVRAVRKF